MTPVPKTLINPNGLTGKQRLAAEMIADDISNGRGIDGTGVHSKVYKAKNKRVASSMSSENFGRPSFRKEIIQGLRDRNVLGVNGKIQRRLAEGLDAVLAGSGKPAYSIRLSYVQEINKILGSYAPVKVDRRTLSVKATVKPKELHQNIEGLEGELSE